MNIYRFCVAIFFLAISFATAQENCRVENVPDKSSMRQWREFFNITTVCYDDGSVPFHANNCFSKLATEESEIDGLLHYRYVQTVKRCSSCDFNDEYSEWLAFPFIEKEICIDPKPDLTEWQSCKVGKDHGFMWITVGDGSDGSPPARYKQEYWLCDDPELYIIYDHPEIEGMPDGDDTEKDNDKDTEKTPGDTSELPNKDGENVNGSDSGSDAGHVGGSENGSDNGNSLTKQDITDAIHDAISCSGNCSGSSISGHVPDSTSDSIYISKYGNQSLSEYIKSHPINIENTKLGIMINSFVPVLPAPKCPVWSIPSLFDSSHLDVSPPCWIFSFIKSIVIIGALFYARRIILGA